MLCISGIPFAIYYTNNETKTNNNSNSKNLNKMKNIVKVIAASVVVFAATTTSSFAQASATASASANIVTPITIAKTVDMNFGNVAVSATTAGTTVLVPAGTRTATGGVTLPAITGTVAAA